MCREVESNGPAAAAIDAATATSIIKAAHRGQAELNPK